MCNHLKVLILFATAFFLGSCGKSNTTSQPINEAVMEGTPSLSMDERVDETNATVTQETKLLYGITLDSLDDVEATTDALESFETRVTARVVFDEDIFAMGYKNALVQLSKQSDIMGELFDSEYIPLYPLEGYKERVEEYLDTLGHEVTIWEIGNEINGEWAGKPEEVAEKTLYAFQAAKKRGYQTALTLYYNDYSANDGCWNTPEEKMRTWVRAYLDRDIKENIDYVLLSYYEEDCDHYRPTVAEWQGVFEELGEIFPHAKLGFGEVGTTHNEEKTEYLHHYYTLTIDHPRYIGGYFWWYGTQDMVPKSKPLWQEFNTILKEAE